jgi:hypothetical protein
MVSGRGTSQVRDGSGPGLTWAEKATNKEYYLSMKTGMESRNRGLAAAAVNELGGRAVWGSGRAADVRSGSFTPPASQGFTGGSGPMRIEVSLSGDGVVTGAMAQVAQVTVNGVVQETRMALRRQGSQG